MSSPLLAKSLDFATQIVLFYEEFSKTKKDTTIAKQLLRSATSVGANINEAIYGNSKADFISKLHISLKETGESIYWLTLLKRTNLIEYSFDELLSLAEEIKRMLIASFNCCDSSNLYKPNIFFILPFQKKRRFLIEGCRFFSFFVFLSNCRFQIKDKRNCGEKRGRRSWHLHGEKDDIAYEYKDRQNILKVKKNI